MSTAEFLDDIRKPGAQVLSIFFIFNIELCIIGISFWCKY